MRPTVAEIDLAALRHNIRQIKMKSRDLIMVVAKANAYGHGDVEVALTCEEVGADFVAVVTMEEGIHLREHAVDLPILVFGGTLAQEDYNKLNIYELSIAVYNKEQIEMLGKLGRSFNIHLKIDTGMGRLGIAPNEVNEYLDLIESFDNLNLEGVMSHFAASDTPALKEYTKKQILTFDQCLETIFNRGFNPIVHINNSAGTFAFENDLSMVENRRYMNRVGLTSYGYSYVDTNPCELKKVMQIKTKIVSLKTIQKGQSVSYGCEFTAEKETQVAVLPIGYADGYKRSYRDAFVIVNGQKANVLGRICMDHTMIDVTGIENVQLGTPVTVMGKDGEVEIWADDLAKLDNTIAYEVLTSISYRATRRAINETTD